MTVREAVVFAAFLRLPASMTSTEKYARVDEVLRWLSLTHVANQVIGAPERKGISGGERRRVSIAMELVRNPPLLFADEPTSGLDSFTAYQCASILADIAHKHQRTIVATLHQPSSEIFALFDDLILLEAGHVVYAGEAQGALPYFQRICGIQTPPHTNPSDMIFSQHGREQIGGVTAEREN
jgi:ABC-type multidrug transport system ATPase subunit